ncbi:hypothetical protein AB0I91_30370 [Actinosynnema sp. NPDC049800]
MSAEPRTGGPRATGGSADPPHPSSIAVVARATSFLKPIADSAPQAGSAVAPAVVEERSAHRVARSTTGGAAAIPRPLPRPTPPPTARRWNAPL